jgi:hypothetical protein
LILLHPTKDASTGLYSQMIAPAAARLQAVSWQAQRQNKAASQKARRLSGGDDRIRTDDPLVANEVLSQLSYIPYRLPPSLVDTLP